MDFQSTKEQTVIVQLLWEPPEKVIEERQKAMLTQMTPSLVWWSWDVSSTKKTILLPAVFGHKMSMKEEGFQETALFIFSPAHSNSHPLLEMAQGLK